MKVKELHAKQVQQDVFIRNSFHWSRTTKIEWNLKNCLAQENSSKYSNICADFFLLRFWANKLCVPVSWFHLWLYFLPKLEPEEKNSELISVCVLSKWEIFHQKSKVEKKYYAKIHRHFSSIYFAVDGCAAIEFFIWTWTQAASYTQ